jgi:hypothetical protein
VRHKFSQEGKIEGSLLRTKKKSQKMTRGKSHVASRGGTSETTGCTHPDNHHLHRDVLRKADRSSEVHGQGDKKVEDGHQVLSMDGFERGEKERDISG